MDQTISLPKTAGNEATGLLKLIALVLMFCDHVGVLIFPGVRELRIIGRMAFPLYSWCIVVGACYSRHLPKYLLRLMICFFLYQPLYNLVLRHTWAKPNVFLTLSLGLFAISGLKQKKLGSQVWAPAAALMIASFTACDYGWKGVLLMILLYAARTSRPALAAVMTAFCLFWGSASSNITSIFGCSTAGWSDLPVVGALIVPWLRLQAMAILSLPLILWRCPVKVRLPKWVWYLQYPAHLLVLEAVSRFFIKG